MTFVVLGAVNELDDIVDLARGDCFQDLHLIVPLKVLRELAQQSVNRSSDPLYTLEVIGARARPARILDFFYAGDDVGDVARKLSPRAPEVDLKRERVLFVIVFAAGFDDSF